MQGSVLHAPLPMRPCLVASLLCLSTLGATGLSAQTAEVTSKDTPFVFKSTSNLRFHTGEAGFFCFEVYEPLLAAVPAAKPDAPLPVVGVQIRILDRATGQPRFDTGVKIIGGFMRAGNPVVPIVSPLPSASLPAGAWKLEGRVMRETGDPVVRTADFDVTGASLP